ncbi:MAG: PAS domain-containing sensor histidine kinase [Cyclobacteriaceae bacterium]
MLREVRWNVAWRVALIVALALVFAFVLMNRGWFFTPLVIGILIMLVTWNLIHYLERTSNDVTQFILAVKQGGFNTNFPDTKRGRTFRKLSQALNDVIAEFQKLDLRRELQHQYLEVLTNNLPLAIISYDANGMVRVCNPFAKNLLQAVRLGRIVDLEHISHRLFMVVNELEPGERKLLRVLIGEKERQLSIQKMNVVVGKEASHILIMQDLKAELDDKEVDAWQKLIRVLTHEIMNSVTPIVSLAEAMNHLILNTDGTRKDLQLLDADDRDDLFGCVTTIENRSKGLLQFVNAYKDYTKTPDLNLAKVNLPELAQRTVGLMKSGSDFESIEFKLTFPRHAAYAMADVHWLEQVLINLLKNAAEAIGDSKGTIEIQISEGAMSRLTVIDNGPGIEPESLEKVFVPFYTTKKNGTGIGLSLSRQIMKLHGGNLELTSQPGKGTAVTLSFSATV